MNKFIGRCSIRCKTSLHSILIVNAWLWDSSDRRQDIDQKTHRMRRWVKWVEDDSARKQMATKLKGGKDKLNGKIKIKKKACLSWGRRGTRLFSMLTKTHKATWGLFPRAVCKAVHPYCRWRKGRREAKREIIQIDGMQKHMYGLAKSLVTIAPPFHTEWDPNVKRSQESSESNTLSTQFQGQKNLSWDKPTAFSDYNSHPFQCLSLDIQKQLTQPSNFHLIVSFTIVLPLQGKELQECLGWVSTTPKILPNLVPILYDSWNSSAKMIDLSFSWPGGSLPLIWQKPFLTAMTDGKHCIYYNKKY